MESPMVSVLTLALLTLATDHVCSQEIIASENPLPVGSNVTLSLSNQTTITFGTWSHGTDNIVLQYPGGYLIYPQWENRVTYNHTTVRLTIRSLQVADSGDYILQALLRARITLSVQEPISNVSLGANATNLVEFNDTALLTCYVSTGSSLSYLWLNGSSKVTADEGVQLGDGGSTLTIVRVTRYDQGPFRCNASNAISDGISQPVYLNISYGPSDPIVTMIPMMVAYKTGSNVTLSCSAESNPPATTQWLFEGRYLDQYGSQLQLENVKENQMGTYKCLVHNTVTSRFASMSATIRIVEPISAVELNRVGGPPILNGSFSLRCEVTGPVDYIHWWKNGQVIPADNTTALNVGNVTLTVNPVQHSDNGDYQCQAFNAVSNMTSMPYEVIMNYGPEKPVIMGTFTSLTGDRVTFNCSASSQPPSHFSWFFNGSLVANTSEYETGPLTLDMSGKYTCMAHNNITGQNSTAHKMLTVFAPVTMTAVKMVGTQPILNHNFSLACEAAGSVESIYWMRNGWPLHADSRRILSPDNTTLTFYPILHSDKGYYQCDASNPLSNMRSDNYTLLVIYGPGKPNITGPEVAKAGDSVTFSCSASSQPPSHFSWYFNGSLVANTSEYETGPLALNMSGTYTCMASNNITGQNSTAYTMLTVLDPIVDVQIENALESAIEGHSYTLSCNVTGHADYIHWMKNGWLLDIDNRTVFSMDNKTVTFKPIKQSDTGDYECMAVSPISNMTSPSYGLTVYYGPGIPSIYGPSLAEKGHSVTFNCSASSQPPSHFSWFFNGSLVANTSEYETGPLTLNMSGGYTCMAYNNVTKQNSTSSKKLTVMEGIESVTVKSNTKPIDSENLTLTCEVTGEYDSIHWMKDNMHLGMNSSTVDSNTSYYIMNNSLHFSPLKVSDDGNYQCVATNLFGPHRSPEYHLLVNYGPLSVTVEGPSSAEIGSVTTVTFRCTSDSEPNSEYQWFLNNRPSVLDTSSAIIIWVRRANEGNYTCVAKNPVTHITMSRTKEFTITGHASALPLQSRGGLMLMALFALSLPCINNWLSH